MAEKVKELKDEVVRWQNEFNASGKRFRLLESRLAVAREALKLLLDCGHELADRLQRHEDSEDVLDWLKLEHFAKKALAELGEKQ